MTIGNALFSRLATQSFGRLQTEIGQVQARISAGTQDPRPSADPARAAQLSAAREHQARLEGFAGQAEGATRRLDLTDTALGSASEITRQLYEIAVKAGDASLPPEGFQGLRTEAEALRTALLGAANETDAQGRPLFAGQSPGPAFEDTGNGVVYRGDDARTVAQVTESLRLDTGLTGAEVFEAVPDGETGTDASLFDMVDDLVASLGAALRSARSEATAPGAARLEVMPGAAAPMAFTLDGPGGSARIDLAALDPASVAAAVDAASAQTGVTASVSPSGAGVDLSAAGELRVSDLRSTGGRAPAARLTALDARGQAAGAPALLADARLGKSALVGRLSDAVDHLAERRATAGAFGAEATRQQEVLAQRKLTLDEAVSGLEDLDIAAAVTRLQTLLLTEQASQQTFVKITSASLFDYMR